MAEAGQKEAVREKQTLLELKGDANDFFLPAEDDEGELEDLRMKVLKATMEKSRKQFEIAIRDDKDDFQRVGKCREPFRTREGVKNKAANEGGAASGDFHAHGELGNYPLDKDIVYVRFKPEYGYKPTNGISCGKCCQRREPGKKQRGTHTPKNPRYPWTKGKWHGIRAKWLCRRDPTDVLVA